MIRTFRFPILILAIAVVAGCALAAFAYREAHGAAVVRRASIALPNWPSDAPPITVALASDIHVGGGSMSPARLERLIGQIAAERPDLALFAGDFIDGHDAGTARAAAPVLAAAFARLRPPLGTVAVLGNHDNDSDPASVAAALRRGGVIVLENEAVRAGPLAVGGVGDAYSGHDRLAETARRLRPLGGARLILTHSPDVAPGLSGDMPLLLAGHTHCGQIVLPLVGALWIPARHGRRYGCGIIRENGRTVVVGAGLGTSLLPLRFGAPPDVWLIRLHGAQQPAPRASR